MKKKNHVLAKVLAVLAAGLMFASFSPSLDGRAVVVDDGVFPQGLFAKTVGYLPGDIISVANVAQDTTVDLLVIGALDPSEGVAIMLSPEAAAAIGIDKDANNLVKITKRSGQDERVYGTAIIAKANELTPAEEEETIIPEESNEAFENETEVPVETPAVEEALDEEPFADEEEVPAFDEETEEEVPAFDEETVEPEDYTDDTESDEEEAAEPEEENLEAVEEETFDESEDAEEESVEPEAYEEENYEDQFVEEDEDAEETEEEIAVPFDEEAAEEESYEEETESEYVEPENFEEYKEEIAEPLVDESPAEEFEEETEAEDEDDDETDAIIEAELEDYDEALSNESEAETEEEYEAIVLVPVDAIPPVAEDTPADQEDTVIETAPEITDEVEDVEHVEEADEDAAILLEPVTPVVQNVSEEKQPEVKPAETSYEKYMVGSLSQLESGKYYIQIGAYSTDESIMAIINKYGNNYPITVVPMAGGVRKQVMVGPLSMDEYAVVLERFKSYGYKDAFLRKIK